jgi:hypothetical protein
LQLQLFDLFYKGGEAIALRSADRGRRRSATVVFDLVLQQGRRSRRWRSRLLDALAAREREPRQPRPRLGVAAVVLATRMSRGRVRWLLISAGVAAAGAAALVLGCLTRSHPSDASLQRIQHSLSGVDEGLESDPFDAPAPKPSHLYSTPLIAQRFDAWAYTKMDPRSQRLGSVRERRVLWGKPEPSRRGCRGGWYALAQGGYACASGSFRRLESGSIGSAALPPVSPDPHAAALDEALPYRYVQVTAAGAPRYLRLPTPEAELSVRTGGEAPGVLDVRMVGDYFLAIIGEELDAGRLFYRTLRDRFVRAEDVTACTPSALHGIKHPSLPLAFVIDDEAAVLQVDGGEAEPIGTAQRYSSFAYAQTLDAGGRRLALGRDGLAMSAESVRVALAQPRPGEVGAQEKWITVDLSEQTLVAYEGDRAVFATLISSGKAGHDTPTGAFRIRHKHVSTTMRGDDPIDGPYEVEEVPWTMYYSGGYALHGAYWHDEFGRVRSHGCTNIAPADARWLLSWTDPPLPAGWHSIRRHDDADGTRVYITD